MAAKLVLGGTPRMPRGAAQCQMGHETTYGLHFKSFTSLDDAGPITVAALQGGEVQVAPLSSDDGSVLGNGFVALVDDKHLLDADNLHPGDPHRRGLAARCATRSMPLGAAHDRPDVRALHRGEPGPRGSASVARRGLVQHNLI